MVVLKQLELANCRAFEVSEVSYCGAWQSAEYRAIDDAWQWGCACSGDL